MRLAALAHTTIQLYNNIRCKHLPFARGDRADSSALEGEAVGQRLAVKGGGQSALRAGDRVVRAAAHKAARGALGGGDLWQDEEEIK